MEFSKKAFEVAILSVSEAVRSVLVDGLQGRMDRCRGKVPSAAHLLNAAQVSHVALHFRDVLVFDVPQRDAIAAARQFDNTQTKPRATPSKTKTMKGCILAALVSAPACR